MYFYGIIIYYVKIIKKILWVEHKAGHIIGNNSMKLQLDDCFPDFANSESFFIWNNGCFKNMRISNEKNKLDLKKFIFQQFS